MGRPQWVRVFLAACLAAATAPGVVTAQARPGTLSGVITNLSGVPIPRAEVLITGTELHAVTGDSGIYEFRDVPAGKYKLIARRIGFEPEESKVTIEDGRHRQIDFEMKGMPELLDSVMVREMSANGRMADFWARRMLGVGAFMTRQDIDRRKPQRSSDLLRTIGGVKVIMGESGFDKPVIIMGRNAVVSRGRTGVMSLASDCKITYYLDGQYVPPGEFHIDDLSPLMLEAVEVYRGPSETPARFRQRETACGVIAVWTREPSRDKPPGSE